MRVFCQYAYICMYICTYMSLCHACPQFLYVKHCWINKGHFWKKREVSTQNLHIVKNVNESLNIFGVFDLFVNSPTKLPSVNTCMIVSYQKVGKKIETVAWTLYFNKIVFICWILHVMFTLKLMAVNKSLWQRIIILQVFLVLFKRNNPLWLHIDSQLILRIVN